MSDHQSEQRRHLRFPPPEWEIALIQCSDAPVSEDEFEPDIAGLVMEESHVGCGLVVIERLLEDRLASGDRCMVKVARLGIVLAQVRWIRPMEGGVARLGLHYLDQTG
ncbi:MAG: hypothetical protein EA370_08820 [Wenzhouxiangella sp.]|nr:MAG: hypothetical protein EA370_08820 [Wenzhouxiangella sp.]